MGFGILNKIKSFFSPDTQQVAEAKPVTENKNTYTVPMAGENKEKPVDKVEIKQNSRNRIYNKLAELCEEYRMSMDDVKNTKLLESIAGVEDISTLSDEEIEEVFNVLKDALGIFGHWKAFWNKRDINDIRAIAKDANQRLINSKTGGSKFGQWWHDLTTNNSLKELIGYKEGDDFQTKFKEFFRDNYLKDIENLPSEEKVEAYKDALEKFGYFLNNTNGLEKEVIAAAISLLRAEDRALAADITIRSCGSNRHERANVAESVEENREEIVSKKDAFNKRPDTIASTEIAKLTFGNMNEEQQALALERMHSKSLTTKERIDSLNEKKKNGTITAEENAQLIDLTEVYNNYTKAGYTGALIGIEINSTIAPEIKSSTVKQIIEKAEENGILNDVYRMTYNYLENKPNISTQEKNIIINSIEKATNHKYSAPAEIINTRTRQENTTSTVENKNIKSRNITNNTETAQNKVTPTINKTLTSKTEENIYDTNVQEKNNAQYVTNSISTKKQNPFSTASTVTPNNNNFAIENKNIVDIVKEMGIEGFNEKVETKGSIATVTEVYNNISEIYDKAVVLKAEKIYKTLEASRQADILRTVGNEGLHELLKITSADTLKMLEGETFTNFWATEQVENAIQEINEIEYKQQNTLSV